MQATAPAACSSSSRRARSASSRTATFLPTPFLDLSASVLSSGERGLLGLAFHPSYETNGKFYVDFVTKSGDTAINEYRVSADPNVGEPGVRPPDHEHRRSRTATTRAASSRSARTATCSSAWATGARRRPGQPRPEPRTRCSARCCGSTSTARPARARTGSRRRNPYVGKAGLDEIYSRGLRNPWRFSFDRVTADLWIGDVGQGRYEEIDRSTSTSGRGRGVNYGWKVMEGRACFSPPSGCRTSGKILPVVAYNHSQGDCSVIGGYVYRGPSAPTLVGRYLFADFCTGRIWSIARAARGARGSRRVPGYQPQHHVLRRGRGRRRLRHRPGRRGPTDRRSVGVDALAPRAASRRSLTTQRSPATLLPPCRTVPRTDEGVASRP